MSAGVAAVHALFLVRPALGDFDLTVAAAVSVADHEVIAAAVEAQDLAVFRVDLVIVTACGGTVVQHDVLPGPVGLVGIDQLVGTRVIQKRLEAFAQTGAPNATSSRCWRSDSGHRNRDRRLRTATERSSGPGRAGPAPAGFGGGGGVV